MKQTELDKYLREPTLFELYFLDPDASENISFDEYERVYNLKQNPKMFSASIKDTSDFKSNSSNFDIQNGELIMQTDKEISFYVHPRYFPVPGHRHSFLELIYVYSGQCTQIINDKTITMKQGEICILDTNTFHSIERAGQDDIIINCLMRKSYFDTAFLSRLSGNDIFTSFFIHAIYQSKNTNEYILLHSGENEVIQNLMNTILGEYFDRKMCAKEVINSYMIILFAEMLRVYRSDVNKQHYAELKNTKMSDVIQYIQSNNKTATLETTARNFSFDAAYLSKAIKKITGFKFMDLVHQSRLADACKLLEVTDLPIHVIANEAGYENVNFFYQIFKRRYLCSPAEYRKTNNEYPQTNSL